MRLITLSSLKKNPDTLLFKKYNIDSDTMERFNLPFEAKSLDIGLPKHNLFGGEDLEDIKEDEEELRIPAENEDITKPGDIWLLGNHRLMCGDCREIKSVMELMNGEMADICVTDPPYNVSYQGDTPDQLTIDNDSMENDMFLVFLRQVFSYMFKIMKPGAAIYVFHADGEGGNFRVAFKTSRF